GMALFAGSIEPTAGHGKRSASTGGIAINAVGPCQPAGLGSPEVLFGVDLESLAPVPVLVLGLAADFGLGGLATVASVVAGLSAALGAAVASGLALACLTGLGLVSPAVASAAASGFLAATRDFLPRCRIAWVSRSESAATAATRAAPVRVG